MSIQETLPEQRSAALDTVLAELAAGETAWAATSLAQRRELLVRIHTLTGRHAEAWVDAGAQIKGLPAGSPLLGEEWLSGPYALLSSLAVLIESLQALATGGSPVDGYPF